MHAKRIKKKIKINNAHTCTHFTTLNILIRKYCEMDIDLEKKSKQKKGKKEIDSTKEKSRMF